MVVVLIVVIKTLDLLDHVNSNGHADLVVSINSRWIGVVDECQSLVEITDVGKNVLEATIDSLGGPVSICSWSNFSRSKNLENRENFVLEIIHSLVKMKLLLICLLYVEIFFHKTKYREKTFESRVYLIAIFLFRKCDICKTWC
jgi:hypothetical protein